MFTGRLLDVMHYGTACPVLDHALENRCIDLVFIMDSIKIAVTPSNQETARLPASGEETMSSHDRRYDPRVNVRMPLRFRILNSLQATEQIAESENISRRGIYFTTAAPLDVGTALEVYMHMPKELDGATSSDVRCVGHVVHVRADSLLGGRAGVGFHIEQYQAKASASERWMS
jgi:PilZ domain